MLLYGFLGLAIFFFVGPFFCADFSFMVFFLGGGNQVRWLFYLMLTLWPSCKKDKKTENGYHRCVERGVNLWFCFIGHGEENWTGVSAVCLRGVH